VREEGGEFQRLGEPAPEQAGRAARETERLASERPALAARGVGEILDVGLDVLRARFAACAGVCAILWIGPAWLTAYLPPESWALRAEPDPSPEATVIWTLVGSGVNTLITALVQALATMVVALIVRGEFAGEPVSVGAAFGIVGRRFLPLVATGVLTIVITMAGLFACLLPYFYLLWKLSLAPLCCAVEGQGPFESLARSFTLTSGSFLRWLGIAVVGGLFVAPLSLVVGAGAAAEVREAAIDGLVLDADLYALVLWLACTLLFAVSTAVTAAFSTAYYYDCLVRREALDLCERLRGLAPARSAA
jgi:hypothetical protein